MIIEAHPPLCNSAPASDRRRHYAAHVFRSVFIAAGCAIVVVALFLSIGKFHLSDTGRGLLVAFIYCALIATPSIVLLTWISHRYSERFPRLIVLMRALVLVCTSIAGSLGAGLVLRMVGIIPHSAYWIAFRETLPFCVVISLVFGLSITSYEALRYKFQAATLELRTKQMEQERAYKLLAEARLSSLESRIHPHFLFNTLNSIAALIPSDPARAEDTIGKLASLLRFSLNANQSGLVPLSQELKIVRDYLEIEKTRFGARIRYEIAVPETLDDVRVPPLALQSLVENAVKHVASKRPQGVTIQVIGSKDGNRVYLQVIDDGPGFSLEAIAPEHGLCNLMARLELLYGSAGRLDVTREEEKTAVRLSFPA